MKFTKNIVSFGRLTYVVLAFQLQCQCVRVFCVCVCMLLWVNNLYVVNYCHDIPSIVQNTKSELSVERHRCQCAFWAPLVGCIVLHCIFISFEVCCSFIFGTRLIHFSTFVCVEHHIRCYNDIHFGAGIPCHLCEECRY